MGGQAQTAVLQDRVLVVTRILALVIVPILLAAFIMLYLLPDDTGRLFAWPIKPRMSAIMLGATYLGGAYYFAMVVVARRWHTIRLGLLPFIIPVVWFINRRVNQSGVREQETPLPRALCLVLGGLGALLTAVSVALFFIPQVMIPAWPWDLTPLTARIMAAVFALSGLVGLGVAIDRRWSSASIPLQAQGISIILILLAIPFAISDMHWSRWGEHPVYWRASAGTGRHHLGRPAGAPVSRQVAHPCFERLAVVSHGFYKSCKRFSSRRRMIWRGGVTMWWRPWRRVWYWRRPFLYRRPLFFGPAVFVGGILFLIFACVVGAMMLRFMLR